MPAGSHTITLNDTTHGSISVSEPYAAADDTVVVTVTADDDYVLSSLKYSYDGGAVENTIVNQGGVYSFTMPDDDVTITATFSEAPTQTGLLLSATGDKNSGDYNDYDLVDVLGDIVLLVDYAEVGTGEIVNNMILPTEPGNIYVQFSMCEGYKLLGIYFKNSNVMIDGNGDWGCAEFDVQEGDTALVLVVRPN